MARGSWATAGKNVAAEVTIAPGDAAILVVVILGDEHFREEEGVRGAIGDRRQPRLIRHTTAAVDALDAEDALGAGGRGGIVPEGSTAPAGHVIRPRPQRIAVFRDRRVGPVARTVVERDLGRCGRRVRRFVGVARENQFVGQRLLFDERQKKRYPAMTLRVEGGESRKLLVRVVVVVRPKGPLLEVVGAGAATGRFPRRLHRRQQEPDECTDDRDHD